MTQNNHYISVAMMRSVLSFIESKGLDKDKIAADAGVSIKAISDSEEFVPAECYPKLMQAAIAESNEPDLGFQLGQQAQPDRWGILGFILSSCRTVAEAMQCQQRYQKLVGNIGNIEININGPFVELAWVTQELPIPALAEEALAGWVTFGRWITGLTKSPNKVTFRHSPTTDIENYERFFECPVAFNCDKNALEIPFTFFNLPVKNFADADRDWLFDEADQQLNRLKDPSSFLVEVQNYICETLPKQVPELGQVAAHFDLNPRAFQRKLKKDDLTFKQLLDQTRMDLAKRFLRHSDYGIIDITFLLGFSEQSAFTRAFKRATGQSPGEFRKLNLLPSGSLSNNAFGN
ncbi:MAG: AraC family transcriptional regulator [Pseudomonadales bacterium]|nr:AraC family transcriptional regulator [Pseudomonadales bacterium]